MSRTRPLRFPNPDWFARGHRDIASYMTVSLPPPSADHPETAAKTRPHQASHHQASSVSTTTPMKYSFEERVDDVKSPKRYV
jgi:hypothetical protein